MCMDKKNEFGETYVYFSQMKRYLSLSKIFSFVTLYVLFVLEEVQILQLKPM